MRSAILKDVAHADLENALGNHLETGWTIKSILPSAWIDHVATSGYQARSVTHWTIVLEGPFATQLNAPAQQGQLFSAATGYLETRE